MAPKSSFLEKIQRRFSCADYVALTRANRNYRLYVLSHMCQHAGDWFVRIASLISVQRITGGSATALSIVVMCRTIPELALAPFGGILADKFDRRNLMIKLDLLAALSVCLFIHAVKANSIHLLYLATVIRSIISATYMPITGAIVPQIIVSGKEDLKRAATLNGMIWSGMLVIGGVVAGRATARFGVELCYIIDILTYIISAVIMSGVSGNFLADADVEKPPQDTKGNEKETIAVKMFALLRTLYQLKKELILYLWYSGFGALIFLKSSGTLIWGAADILNVSFSHIENDEAESSRRMGALYSSIGIGCLIGPIVANSTIVDGKKPATLQLAILFGLAMLTIGWLGVASNASSFKLVCFFTAIRTTGSSLIWLFSTLLMQNLASPEILGRVLGLEYCFARVSESIIAYIAGRLQDGGHAKSEISYIAAGIGFFFLAFWSSYHLSGRGAAQRKWNTNDDGRSEVLEVTLLTCPNYEHDPSDVMT